MKAVLRIALYFFAMVPLQKWLNIAGLVLLALSVGLDTRLLGLLGCVLLAITPAMMGGVGLRYAATASVLHLRPHGRIKLVAGATLALTAMAAIVTLPWIDPLWRLISDETDNMRGGTGDVFLFAWAVLSLWWIGMFAISFSYPAFSLIGVVPVVGLAVGRYLIPLLPGPGTALAICLLAWSAFGMWLLRTPSVRRPQVLPMGGAMDPHAGTPFQRLLSSALPSGTPSRNQAAYLLLFGSGPRIFIITGLWVVALFLVVFALGPMNRAPRSQALFMLPFLAFFQASIGTSITRRARLLWLRGGVDRSAMFSLAERWGLRSAMTTWGIVAALTLIAAVVQGNFTAPQISVYFVAHAVAATAVFYGGMVLVRGWSVHDVVLTTLMALAVVAQAILAPRFLDAGPLAATAWLAALSAIALALRWHAGRQWKSLDWRVAKIPQWTTRAG